MKMHDSGNGFIVALNLLFRELLLLIAAAIFANVLALLLPDDTLIVVSSITKLKAVPAGLIFSFNDRKRLEKT